MLQLKNIVKEYGSGDQMVTALKGVNVDFPKTQFVAVLGPSGCGKTTLLNIIGGLDSYTSGDLTINGRSTKQYKDRDWDTYRNHSIGFVFQSYNLIPHQTVLSNVELALTLSGVSKTERRKRAMEALTKVGLENQIHKKPNEMSGGQMQRVAIARSLVNNPDILLADEPTGALDSETSIQIMEILKEIAKEKLVIMVTHNPELAEEYANRIIRLKDGEIISDTTPYTSQTEEEPVAKKKSKKTSMSFFTALSLSFNNLLTKKARTILTSFAGSIGIIGIALILSLSNGIDVYINTVEENTLSNYPITIEETSINLTEMMTEMMGANTKELNHPLDKIYANNIMSDMANAMVSEINVNNLKDFKTYLENPATGIDQYVSDVQYQYATTMHVYKPEKDGKYLKINPNDILLDIGYSEGMAQMSAITPMNSVTNIWQQLLDNPELLNNQYEVIAGHLPEKANEIIVIVDKNNEISDYTLYSLGLLDPAEVKKLTENILSGKEYVTENASFTYDELLSQTFKLMVNSDYYAKQDDVWVDKSSNESFVNKALENAIEIKICGIVRPSDDSLTTSITGAVGYTEALMKELITKINNSEIVKDQKEHPDTDIFTGITFPKEETEKIVLTSIDDVKNYIQTLPQKEQAQAGGMLLQMQQNGMKEQEIVSMFQTSINSQTTDATYDGNLLKMGAADLSKPSTINIFPKDFQSKDAIADIIHTYNETASDEDDIRYNDYIGLMMSSITTIINAISYILIAFVAVSLVVSSIMIGIITYISVLERTKEIGVLRAMGASKRDISRVFNAETLLIGFVAGALGIGITLLLNIPINLIIEHLTDIQTASRLPAAGGIILVVISMCLTLIAGLIPSRIAAKKDPVVALRTE